MSHAVTIDNLSDEAFRRLESEARLRGKDIATVAGALLDAQLGGGVATKAVGPHHELDHLAGTWTEAQAKEFDDAVAVFGVIDEELWR